MEFTPDEREDWYLLRDHRASMCPHCGLPLAICSDPGGLTGDGFHINQSVCYPSMIREATLRRVSRKFRDTSPDLQGFLPNDGVFLDVSLVETDSEDILGIEGGSDLLGDGAAGVDQP